MILNHLHLHVSDVPSTVSFFETFFGLTAETSRTSPAFAILSDGAGFVLVLQRWTAGSDASRVSDGYPDGFHLGFLVDDIAIVESTHAALVRAGVEVSDIDTNNRGTMIYCRHPDGFLVEVSCRKKH
jgi:catechol 2,3-dioxygenase-like lactoylglutathione lyase family enzyme